MSKNRRDGSKLSFAERDKLRRDRGSGRRDQRGPGPANSAKAAYAQKSYKAALERAFADGKVEEFAATLTRASAPPNIELPKKAAPPPPPPRAETATTESPSARAVAAQPAQPSPEALARAERRKLIDKIKEATGGRDIAAAVDRYLAKFDPLPSDYEVLEKALAHPSSAIVTQVLHQLIAQLDGSKPRRSRSLAMQLEILEDTGDDAEVRELARRARERL